MREKIAQVLLEQLEYQEYRDITVSVLCECVPVSRPTFYKYFKSKDDVARWYITEDFLENAYPIFKYHLREKGTQAYFTYIREHQDFYKKIYDYDKGALLENCLKSAYMKGHEYVEKFSRKVPSKKGKINHDVFTRYSISGIASVVIYWIENEMKIPEEVMAHELYLMMEEPLGVVRDYYL